MILHAFFRASRVLTVLLGIASVALVSGPSVAATDQAESAGPAVEAPEADTPGSSATEPGDTTGRAPRAGKTEDGKPGPETTEDRDRILGDLYKRLAEADNPDFAKLVETAIQKMWGFSGSDTVDLLMSRAQTTLGKDNKKSALRLLNAVIGLDPQYAEGWNRRAFVHFSRKDYGAALRDLQKVLLLDPKHYKAIGGLAVILREYGRDAAALKAFRKALEINPLDPDTVKAVKELEVEVEGQAI